MTGLGPMRDQLLLDFLNNKTDTENAIIKADNVILFFYVLILWNIKQTNLKKGHTFIKSLHNLKAVFN